MPNETVRKYLDTPMQDNDANAETIGEYLKNLLLALWDEKDGFSGKRPFGNGGWEYELYAALISAGYVDGSFDEDGYIESVDYELAEEIIRETIKGIYERGV
jgi:hypothetical protein